MNKVWKYFKVLSETEDRQINKMLEKHVTTLGTSAIA